MSAYKTNLKRNPRNEEKKEIVRSQNTNTTSKVSLSHLNQKIMINVIKYGKLCKLASFLRFSYQIDTKLKF